MCTQENRNAKGRIPIEWLSIDKTNHSKWFATFDSSNCQHKLKHKYTKYNCWWFEQENKYNKKNIESNNEWKYDEKFNSSERERERTSVHPKMEWFVLNEMDYIDFSQHIERTNVYTQRFFQLK